MKKKILTILLALLTALCLSLGISACGDRKPDNSVGDGTQTEQPDKEHGGEEKPHEHSFTNYIYNNDATCTENGTETATCEFCHNAQDTREVKNTALGHDWDDGVITPATCTTSGQTYYTCNRDHNHHKTEEIKVDPAAHKYSATLGHDRYTHYKLCEYCGKKVDIGYHSFSDNKTCADCKCIADYTLGLEFELNSDGVTCALADIGTASDADIIIPDEYYDEATNTLYPVTKINTSAFAKHTVNSIVVPDSVTTIAQGAFIKCIGLTSITLPFVGATKDGSQSAHFGYIFGGSSVSDNVDYVPASLKTVIITGGSLIGDSAFRNCSGLTEITIPESVTSIGNYAFNNCSGLTEITIPESVTSIGSSAFYGCNSLESITLPFVGTKKDESKNVYLGYIFGAYSYSDNNRNVPASLKTVIITGGSLIGNYAFYNCNGLESITIPQSVTSIGDWAFYGCNGLTEITIPQSVTSIGSSAFSDCNGLQKVHISDLSAWCEITFSSASSNPLYNDVNLYLDDTPVTALKGLTNFTEIKKYAFNGDKSLTSIIIPKSVISIGDGAFEGCSGLASVTIEKDGNLTTIGNSAFGDCSGLESITVPDGVISIGDAAFGNCCRLTEIFIPESVISIGNYAFNGCSWLTGVIFEKDSDLTSIGEWAFSDCTSLANITIPESVTSIGSSAFRNCSGLESITIPFVGATKDGPINFGCIFGATGSYKNEDYVPASLKTVIITGGVSIGNYAFDGCSWLESIEIPNSVTSIGNYAFENCSKLEGITIPKSVTSLGDGAFKHCSELTSVTFEQNSNLTSIGSYAFYDCESLTSILIPKSVTSIASEGSNGSYVFYNCSGLTSVTFEKDSNLTTIGSYAFYICNELQSVTIPNSVTSIGISAFNRIRDTAKNQKNLLKRSLSRA